MYQDYCWEDHGYSLVNRLYPDVGQLIDEKFHIAYNLTYNTMAMHKDVDTSMLRRAIWNYIHCMFGIRSVWFLNVYKDTSFTQKSSGACSTHVCTHARTHARTQLILKFLSFTDPRYHICGSPNPLARQVRAEVMTWQEAADLGASWLSEHR